MSGSLLAAVAALFSLGLWLATRRRPAPRLAVSPPAFTDPVEALNPPQLALLPPAPVPHQVRPLSVGQPAPLAPLPRAGDARQRQLLLSRLGALMAGDRSQRLAAIQQAHRWGERAVLPLLRRGLRDVDPAVCAAAAQAIERYRGRIEAVPVAAQIPQVPLPRNVARTR